MIKTAALSPAVPFACVLQCSGQQKSSLSDQQVLTAAGSAFKAGKWNPEIFEALPDLHVVTVEEVFRDTSDQEHKRELLKEFGNGSFAMVAYQRRPATLKTNGGESY
jgi:hypothetical protein